MKNALFFVCFLMLLKPVLPVAEYVVNYDYISKVLCVNKAKPVMQCNGKCHLMKELAKASETEKPLSSDKKNSIQESEVLFFQEIATLLPSVIFQNSFDTNPHYTNDYSYLNGDAFFHPPAILS